MCSEVSTAAASAWAATTTRTATNCRTTPRVIRGNHVIKFGGRLRATQDTNVSNSGFNGSFSFSSLNSELDDVAGELPAVSAQNPACPILLPFAENRL